MRGWRKICSDGGAAIVETAFAAAVTLALLVGNFQMFSALYTYHYVSYAAREGSRYAIVRGSQCATDSATMPNCNATSAEIQTYVESLGFPGINTNDMTVTTTWLNASATQPTTWSACAGSGCNIPGNMVQVNVVYAFPLNIPFVKSQSLNIASTSAMVISQ